MSFFLRKVRRDAWDGGTQIDEGWRLKALKDFSLREGEESWSLFEAHNDEDRALVSAAFALRARQKAPVDLLEIPEATLTAFGVVDRDGDGDTPIAAVNELHVSFRSDAQRLGQLAERLRSQGAKAIRQTWGEHVLPTLRRLDPDDLVEDPEAAEWLRSLQT